MTQLAAAIGANDEFLHLDEPLPSGTYFRIDDELVAVTGRMVRATRTNADGTIVSVREGPEPDGTIISVKRGLYGTTSAAHDSGTELTAHVDAYTTETPFNVGGEQTVRRIGPFRFNFNETDNFKELTSLDEGVIVMLAWPEIITPFGSGPDAHIELYVGPIAGNWLILSTWFADAAQPIVDAGVAANVWGTTVAHLQTNTPRPARIKTAGNSLIANLNPSDPNTAGAADIYALIAELAA